MQAAINRRAAISYHPPVILLKYSAVLQRLITASTTCHAVWCWADELRGCSQKHYMLRLSMCGSRQGVLYKPAFLAYLQQPQGHVGAHTPAAQSRMAGMSISLWIINGAAAWTGSTQ